MKRLAGIFLLVVLVTGYFGCKKQDKQIVQLSDVVGTYKINGLRYRYSELPPYKSDSTLYADSLMTITKYNDTTLQIGDLQYRLLQQSSSSEYTFINTDPTAWFFSQLTFLVSNPDSVFLTNFESPSPAYGYETDLNGGKVQ